MLTWSWARAGREPPAGKPLLDSQFADLEVPEDEEGVVSLDIDNDLPTVLAEASRLAESPPVY